MRARCFIGILLFFLKPIHLCAAENNPEQWRQQLENKAHGTIKVFLQDIFDYTNKGRIPDEIISGLVTAVAKDFFDYSVGLTDAKLSALIGFYGDQQVRTLSKRLYEESNRLVTDLDKWQGEEISVSVSARDRPFFQSLQTSAEKLLKDRPKLKEKSKLIDKLARRLYSYALREHPVAANLNIEFCLDHDDINLALLDALQRLEDRMKSLEQQTRQLIGPANTENAGDTDHEESDLGDFCELLEEMSEEIDSFLNMLEQPH